ncbi:MAG: DUF1858 domain-containing protein [Melioribacter sp.]|nr:DUF1858 domain-containing protein [Melioribacter sp.]
MTNKNLDITPKTLVGDLLNVYPELEDILIEIAPVFKKLKNPVLRKTIAKVTNLKQASVVGNVSVADLINQLRRAVNQNEIEVAENKTDNVQRPDWVKNGKVSIEYDATIDLESGIHPAGKVTKEILHLNENEIYSLTTPFIPAPLIKIIEEKGFDSYTEKQSESTYVTYIKKK